MFSLRRKGKVERPPRDPPRWMVSQYFDDPRKFVPSCLILFMPLPILIAVGWALDALTWRLVGLFVIGWLAGDRIGAWVKQKIDPTLNVYTSIADHFFLLLTYYFGTKVEFPDGLSNEDCARAERFRYFIIGRDIPDHHEYRMQLVTQAVRQMADGSLSASGLRMPSRPAPRYVRFLRKRDAILFRLLVK